MTDRELLELAAKAIHFKWDEQAFDGTLIAGRVRWNPRDDDGDALRLAGTLGLAIVIDIPTGVTFAHHEQAWMATEVKHYGDPYAATRRAIVRAAAEIGRAMP